MRRRRRVAALTAAFAAVAMLAVAGTQAVRDRELNLETFDEAWRIINETHWDPEFNGVDWEAVRDELRPRAGEAEAAPELRAIINDMISRLGQSHFAVWPRGALGSIRSGDDDGRGRGGVFKSLSKSSSLRCAASFSPNSFSA